MTQRRVENTGVHFWTFSPVSVNQLTFFSNYWIFLNEAISDELSIVSLYLREKRLCDPRIIVKKLKMTHAQPTQKCNILFRYVNWLRALNFLISCSNSSAVIAACDKKNFSETWRRRYYKMRKLSTFLRIGQICFIYCFTTEEHFRINK